MPQVQRIPGSNAESTTLLSATTIHRDEELLKEYLDTTNQTTNKFLHPETRYGKKQLRFAVENSKIVDRSNGRVLDKEEWLDS